MLWSVSEGLVCIFGVSFCSDYICLGKRRQEESVKLGERPAAGQCCFSCNPCRLPLRSLQSQEFLKTFCEYRLCNSETELQARVAYRNVPCARLQSFLWWVGVKEGKGELGLFLGVKHQTSLGCQNASSSPLKSWKNTLVPVSVTLKAMSSMAESAKSRETLRSQAPVVLTNRPRMVVGFDMVLFSFSENRYIPELARRQKKKCQLSCGCQNATHSPWAFWNQMVEPESSAVRSLSRAIFKALSSVLFRSQTLQPTNKPEVGEHTGRGRIILSAFLSLVIS